MDRMNSNKKRSKKRITNENVQLVHKPSSSVTEHQTSKQVDSQQNTTLEKEQYSNDVETRNDGTNTPIVVEQNSEEEDNEEESNEEDDDDPISDHEYRSEYEEHDDDDDEEESEEHPSVIRNQVVVFENTPNCDPQLETERLERSSRSRNYTERNTANKQRFGTNTELKPNSDKSLELTPISTNKKTTSQPSPFSLTNRGIETKAKRQTNGKLNESDISKKPSTKRTKQVTIRQCLDIQLRTTIKSIKECFSFLSSKREFKFVHVPDRIDVDTLLKIKDNVIMKELPQNLFQGYLLTILQNIHLTIYYFIKFLNSFIKQKTLTIKENTNEKEEIYSMFYKLEDLISSLHVISQTRESIRFSLIFSQMWEEFLKQRDLKFNDEIIIPYFIGVASGIQDIIRKTTMQTLDICGQYLNEVKEREKNTKNKQMNSNTSYPGNTSFTSPGFDNHSNRSPSSMMGQDSKSEKSSNPTRIFGFF